MTLKCCFRLSLNKINIANSSNDAADKTAAATSYALDGHFQFNLVVNEETRYLNFVPILSKMANPAVYEQVKDFVRLITREEFVSLTFNSFYIDAFNRKVVFRPHILPSHSFEFDFIDSNLHKLKTELRDVSGSLGFLSLHHLHLDPVDYDFIDNGKYHAALDSVLEEPLY